MFAVTVDSECVFARDPSSAEGGKFAVSPALSSSGMVWLQAPSGSSTLHSLHHLEWETGF